jgi:Ca2+/Na+ antiporter
MDTTTTVLVIIIVLLVAAFIVYLSYQQNKKDKTEQENLNPDNATRSLRLQAYERLTLLVDRIALPNLISRVNQNGISARDMQMLLVRSIREEYDYNISQQIYVTPDAWNALKNLKEQNMLVVNQLATALPPNATGLDLNKLLLEYLMTDKKGQLHEVVGEVLSYEAKKLM